MLPLVRVCRYRYDVRAPVDANADWGQGSNAVPVGEMMGGDEVAWHPGTVAGQRYADPATGSKVGVTRFSKWGESQIFMQVRV